MKIAVVNSALREQEKLVKVITKWSREKNYLVNISIIEDVKAFLKEYTVKKNELIFVGDFSDQITCIEIIEHIRQVDPRVPIVCIADSDQYIFQAVMFHIFDYVKKPYDYQRITYVLNEMIHTFPMGFGDPILKFTCGKKKIYLLISEILYITADNNYTIFMTKNGSKKYRIFFSKVCSLLTDPRFIVCTRGVAVNMDYILKEKQGIFEMKDGRSFPIHRNGKKEIIQKFEDYQLKKLEEKNSYWNINK